MAYIAREIKDRIAVNDDKYYVTNLDTDEIIHCHFEPAPDEIVEEGTDINKELLQPIEDRTVFLMNRFVDNITSNPFSLTLDDLNGVTANGVWNKNKGRIEC